VQTAGVVLTAASGIEHWDMADFHLMSELVPGRCTRRTIRNTTPICACSSRR
jgi:hypothetical protein